MKHLKIYDNMTDYDAASDNLPIAHIAKIEDTGEVIGYPDDRMVAVEYLQSDGSAWIDTGVVIKDNPRVVINIYMTGSLDKDVFGFPSNAQPSFIGNISASSSKQSFQYYRYYTTSSRGSALNSTVPFNTWAEWDMSNVVKCNGSTLATYNRESFAANNQTLRLFNGRGYITTNVVRVGATKIYDGDVLKRDFIPVRLGTVGYMFDKISKRLFGNVGTGSFTYGNDIVPVEYLKGVSGTYINTGIAGNSNVEMNIKYSFYAHEQYGAVYGNYVDENTNAVRLILQSSSNNNGYINVDTKAGSSAAATNAGTKNTPITVIACKTRITINGTSITPPTTNGTVNSTNIALFAKSTTVSPTGTAGVKIFYCKMKQSNILTRDYVPVRIGTTGYLLDKVEWKLYANAGTGSFTYGNDLRSTRIFTAKQF